MILAAFLVEIEDENLNESPKVEANTNKSEEEKSCSESAKRRFSISVPPESSARRFSLSAPQDGEDSAEQQCINPFCLPVMKTKLCISLLVYGFLHYGGMIGVVVFLPALFTESFLPPDMTDEEDLNLGQVP